MRPDAPFDRVLLAAIAGAGALVGHGIGYSLGAAAATTEHGHLSVLVPVLTGVAGAAALVLVTRWAKAAPGRPPYRTLAGAHIGAYLLLELVEAALGSPVAHLSSPGFVIGLLVQPLVAGLVARALATGAELLRSALVRSRRRPARAPRSVRFPSGLPVGGGLVVGAPRRRRGPPLVAVP